MQGTPINLENAEQSIAAAASLDALDHVRVALLGKSGLVTEQLKALGKLAPDERKARGAEINALKEQQAAQTRALRHIIEGRWTGEMPHAAADVVALYGGTPPPGFSPVPFEQGA